MLEPGKPGLIFLKPFSTSDRAWLLERLAPHFELIDPPAFDDATLAACVGDADVALGAAITPAVFAAAKRLKLVQTPGTGVERLNLAALEARGVIVGTSSSHAPQVAEHGLAMLLSLMRKIALHDRLLRKGEWYRPTGSSMDEWYQSDSLADATVGLVGFGAINQALARLLSGFGVRLLVHARRPRPDFFMVELDELFSESLAVVVAVPLTPATRGMIAGRHLLRSKPGPYLVSLGRAEVIERSALLACLREHRIRGAALDVPYGGNGDVAGLAEFVNFDHVVVSPHRAGTLRGFSPHLPGVVANLVAFAQGRPLPKIADPLKGY